MNKEYKDFLLSLSMAVACGRAVIYFSDEEKTIWRVYGMMFDGDIDEIETFSDDPNLKGYADVFKGLVKE